MRTRHPERQIMGDKREALTQELDDQAVHLVRGLLLDRVARVRDREECRVGDSERQRPPQPDGHDPVFLSPYNEGGSRNVLELPLQSVESELPEYPAERARVAGFDRGR